jgi:leucyl aminopeptidase
MEIEIIKLEKPKSLRLFVVKELERETHFLPESKKLYIKIDDESDEAFRLAGGKAMKILEKEDFHSLIIDGKDKIQYILEGILLGSYRFTKYKSEQKEFPVKRVFVESFDGVDEVVSRAKIITTATNFTKDIVNSMPNEMHPQGVVKVAKELAKTNNLEIDVLEVADLEQEKMNAFVAVGRASSNPPALVKMKYSPKNPKKKILLIGKGLTYDSGGLSLKPADAMKTMKSDKSGASAVLGILKAVSELKLDVEVVGFLGLAENMVGGNAYKPDDILVAKNGKTIEVKNTDAEGRLVLADTLVYAQENEKEFDYIFDIATLTGAAVISVGEFTTLVMGHNDKLKKKILKAGDRSGELMATLPFNRYLKEMIKSKIADLSNTGSTRYGGSLTAGLFLSEFIEEKNMSKWLHLDIAGPAYVEQDWGYNTFGAGGAGVRSVVNFIEKIGK